MLNAAHSSVVWLVGLSSSSVVGYFGAGGYCPVPFGPLGGGVSLPVIPPVPTCGLLVSGDELHRGVLAGSTALPLPSWPLSLPPLPSSSSLGPPSGDEDGCEGFDADFRISKAISALFHSMRLPRVYRWSYLALQWECQFDQS